MSAEALLLTGDAADVRALAVCLECAFFGHFLSTGLLLPFPRQAAECEALVVCFIWACFSTCSGMSSVSAIVWLATNDP